jgi:LytS/YehU family sensor histidine kinase
VTELAHEAPAAAARMLNQLASVLRFALQRGGSEVTVGEELAALDPYLEVQRTRFADWISFECQVERSARDFMLPPLILQPLVENAIRHGLERRHAPGQIRITASIRGGKLIVDVRDNGVGLIAGSTEGRGIGTANVRDRLAALYGPDAELRVFNDDEGGAVSRVTVPARLRRQIDADESGVTVESLPDESLVPRWLSDRPVAAIALAWAVWGVLWTQQSVAYLAFRGRMGGTSFGEIAVHDFATAMLWAAVTPLMLVMLRIVPFDERRMGLRVGAHTVAALLIAMLHGWLTRTLLGDDYPPFSAIAMSAVAWGVLAYAVVLIVAYHTRIRAWARERELADARLRVEIAEEELRSTTARVRPQQLLERLDTIAQSIGTDASAAERALARLGDELRAVLDARVRA